MSQKMKRGMEENTNLLAERDVKEGNRMIFKSIKCILRSF